MPIRAEAGVLGTLTVYSRRADAYGAREAELLAILAHQASVAITNARLIEQLDRSRAELARQAAVERALREITAEISAVRDPRRSSTGSPREGAGLLGTERVFINVHRGRPRRHARLDLVLPHRDGRRPVADRGGHPAWARASPARRSRSGGTIITGDYLNDDRGSSTSPGPTATPRSWAASAIAVPIFDGDEPLGALLAESTIPDAFTEADASRLEVLARQAGIALSNARLLERLRRSEAQLRESEARFRYLVTRVARRHVGGGHRGPVHVRERRRRAHDRPAAAEVLGRRFGRVHHARHAQPPSSSSGRCMADPDAVTMARFRSGTRRPDHPGRELRHGPVPRRAARRRARRRARHVRAERLERDLRRQAAELASSTERAHLARELHDSVTQALFAMTLVTRSIELLLPRDREAALERFEELRELQREALAEMRSLIFELRPGELERDGLVQALRTHAAALESRVGLPILLEADLPSGCRWTSRRRSTGSPRRRSTTSSGTRRRDQARVRLELDGDRRCLTVEDDGEGFDDSGVHEGHLGLAGMRARAGRLGGTVTIHSTPAWERWSRRWCPCPRGRRRRSWCRRGAPELRRPRACRCRSAEVRAAREDRAGWHWSAGCARPTIDVAIRR